MSNSQNKERYKNLELLFEDSNTPYIRSEVVKLSSMVDTSFIKKSTEMVPEYKEKESKSSSVSVGTLDESVLNSIQNLFDAQYSSGGYNASQKFGASMAAAFADKEIHDIIHAKHEKQITGIIADKVMEATGAVEYIKNNVDIPQTSGNSKRAVVSVWKKGWESIKTNAKLIVDLFGSVFKTIIGYFERYPWLVAAGFAVVKLIRVYGRMLGKIFKLLKFIPGVSMIFDLALAVKNIYYIQKEIVKEDWNETMTAIGQTQYVVEEPGELEKVNYPNAIARVIGNAIRGLTRKISSAFKMGQVALKCTKAGFECSKIFNEVLEQKEREFLSGNMSAEEFCASVTNHIKASRKIKIVSSEMIGLMCNVSSAIFDLATATGVGIIVTIIGNLIIAGIDMGLREGVISACKTFEDFWGKRLSDYKVALNYYTNFSKASRAKASGNKDEAIQISTATATLAGKDSVSMSDISKENSKAMEESRSSSRNKATTKFEAKDKEEEAA